jgi:hypothetical protein
VLVNDNKSAFSSLNGTQYTESENHPDWRSHIRGSLKGDVGGPFTSRKSYSVSSNEPVTLTALIKDNQTLQTTVANYLGPYLPASPNFLVFPSYSFSSESQLNALGTVAIARCAPTNPAASLSVFIGELINDGVPAAVGDTLSNWGKLGTRARKRAIGNEYLNLEFGWKPFVGDVRKLAQSILHAEDVLNQYERDSGKLVRRRYEFPPISDPVSETVYLNDRQPWTSPSSSNLTKQGWIAKGQVIRTRKAYRRQWFSGGFTYYVPPEKGLRSEMARAAIKARHLLGLSLTPDSVWNLTPWSWALGWFANADSVLKNWTAWAVDNQVLRYAYMMEHSIVEYTYTFVGETGFRRSDTRPPDVRCITESKIRRKATPYGFGLNWNGFSNRQKAILAALGISRLR